MLEILKIFKIPYKAAKNPTIFKKLIFYINNKNLVTNIIKSNPGMTLLHLDLEYSNKTTGVNPLRSDICFFYKTNNMYIYCNLYY